MGPAMQQHPHLHEGADAGAHSGVGVGAAPPDVGPRAKPARRRGRLAAGAE